jgi:BirA family biotin operon repressor/biotin-[acetyl-CoA-carboxylase] ligase
MNIEILKSELINDNYLKDIIYFEELDSTNKYAKINNLSNDTLLITSNQTNGSGRFNRKWYTVPFKDLTFSLIKSVNIGIDEVHLINFYSSYVLYISLGEYLSDYKDIEISLKWPNDIILNRKKIAGIILDVKDLKKNLKKFIIGVGINVNNLEFPDDLTLKATSLMNEIKSEINIEIVLIRFIKNFYEKFYLIKNRNELMKNWLANARIIGERISFRKFEDDEDQSVTVLDIDTDGGLKVKFENNAIKKFYSGEISIVYD